MTTQNLSRGPGSDPQGGMGAWQGLGKDRIGVGILVNIGWWGVLKNVGPRDRSKLESELIAEEI